MMIDKLYPYRFEIFFASQIAILFGSLLIPMDIFQTLLSPILFLVNLFAGIVLMSKLKSRHRFFLVLLIMSGVLFAYDLVDETKNNDLEFFRLAIYFSFYIFVTYEIVKQVWRSKQINKNTMFGLVSGYVSIGLLGFFLCLTIEMAAPDSFLFTQADLYAEGMKNETLMYFSYITLLSIGYGEIVPISSLAQKATVLIGLIGQIYLVVITGIVIGKYLNQLPRKEKE